MENRPSGSAGRIYVAATPIGNVSDASKRLLETLASADLIAAEDTRRLLNLAGRLGVTLKGKVVALHDHNEARQAAQIVEVAELGEKVILVSDAGTPTVSDPGYHVVSLAASQGVDVVPLPGPSAALAALSVSGLPTDRFVFEGFLPRKVGAATETLRRIATLNYTLIFFESPRRTHRTLTLMADVLGRDRQAIIGRELTKTHEEVVRGTLGELVAVTGEREMLGEITIVISGTGGASPVDLQSLVKQAIAVAEREGLRLKEAAAVVAPKQGPRANEIFKEAISWRSNGGR